MDLRLNDLRRFLYSHYFFNGLRQAIGLLLPVVVMGGVFGEYRLGMVATFGAQCLAIIDQPGSPRRHRANELISGMVLGGLTTAITGLASSHPVLIWLAVVAQFFAISMLSVYGRRGVLVGFGTLLLMTLSMHTPMAPHEVLAYTLASLAGSFSYFVFSLVMWRVFALQDERKSLAVALFATADYMAVRANFYDETSDLDATYRQLIKRQSTMIERQQAARDHILRELPSGRGRSDLQRTVLWNTFLDMLRLVDTLVATRTDYAVLRRALAGHDALVFMRDALAKLALGVNQIAGDISRTSSTQYRSGVKAELRAIEYEIEQLRRPGQPQPDHEVISVMVQVLRRLRNAANIVDRMAAATQARPDTQPASDLRIDPALTRFLSKPVLRLGMITSNLRLDSPYCRHALRVTLAAALGMLIINFRHGDNLGAHSYWVLLTIAVVMRPGFALSRQRNIFRLAGTLIGCILGPAIFYLTGKPAVYFALLLFSSFMWLSLLQVNYLLSSLFNTLYVVLVFHFVDPGTMSLNVAGERALDTMLGCALALVCSYVLPWWEARYIRPLAHAATRANLAYLTAGLRYLRAMRHQSDGAAWGDSTAALHATDVTESDLAWRLARKNMQIAFSNFAEAFYRMMREPQQHQVHVPALNSLLTESHILTSQIASVIPTMIDLKEIPDSVDQALAGMAQALDENNNPPPPLPSTIEAEGEAMALIYPIKQMITACTQIRQDLATLDAS
ncbi:MAG TPA: FUSC family membrane protein [Bordetella sp.]